MRIQSFVVGVSIAMVGLVFSIQAGLLWYLQQRLEQQMTMQSGQLSKIVLKRTIDAMAPPAPPDPASAPELPALPQPAAPRQLEATLQLELQGDVRVKLPAGSASNPASQTSATQRTAPAASSAQPLPLINHATKHSVSQPAAATAEEQAAAVIVIQQGDSPVTVQHVDSQHGQSYRYVTTVDALPKALNEQLDQTMQQLEKPGDAAWVEDFETMRSQGSASIMAGYFKTLLAALVISSLVLLSLMVLLSRKLLSPLNVLVDGFRQLASGHAGVTVPTQQPLTEYKFVLEQFNQASQQLAAWQARHDELARQQQLVELGEVSRGLVHALRNPLHTMTLALEQIHADPQSATQLQPMLEQKIHHINRTLTALLTLSSSHIDRQHQVPLDALLQDLALEFSAHQLQLPAPSDVSLQGAETELRTMLHVLVANAVEASPAPATVKICVEHTAQQLKIMVYDQGGGLADSVRHRLFEPHVSSKAEGSGMGLYLCQRLAQLYYQGDVQLWEHSCGDNCKGCVACLTLPQPPEDVPHET